MTEIYGLSFQGDWKKDIFMGLLVGGLFIFSNALLPAIAIGFPTLPQATTTDSYLLVGGVAPVFEEIAFRGVLLSVLIIMFGLAFLPSAIIVSIVFSLYHIIAYAGSIAAIGTITGSLIAAFIFSIVMCYLIKYTNNISSTITAHSMFNIYLLSKMAFVFGVMV